jgi:hypothetical protein
LLCFPIDNSYIFKSRLWSSSARIWIKFELMING